MTTQVLTGRVSSIAAAFSLLRLRAGRYRQVAHWIVMDTIWRFRQRLGLFLLASGLAIAFQAGALALFTSYANRLESNAGVVFAGVALEPAHSYLLLVGAIGVGGAMFVAASFMRTYANLGFSDLGGRYGVFCAERMMTLVSAALHGARTRGGALDPAEVRKLVVNGSQICSRAMYGLIGTLPLFAGLLVYGAFLVYLDLRLTAMIVVAMCLSFLFFYALSVKASTLMRVREEMKRAMTADYAQLLDVIRNAPQPLAPQHPLFEAKVRNGTFARYFAQVFQPKVLGAQSAHVSATVQALVLTVVGLVKGGEIIATGTGFGDLVIFLVAGRMAISNFLGITNSLVMINRFYPTVASYFGLVEQLEGAVSVEAADRSGSAGSTLQLAVRPLGGVPSDRPKVAPGTHLGLVTPRPVDRFSLSEVLGAFRIVSDETQRGGGRPAPGLCWLVPEVLAQAGLTYSEATGLAPGFGGDALRRELAMLGLSEDDLATLPDELNIPMDEMAWERIAPGAVWATHLLAASRADRPLVAVGTEALAALGTAMAQNALNRLLGDRVVLICHRPRDTGAMAAFDQRYVLLFDGESLLGYLRPDEVAAHADVIAGMDKKARVESAAGVFDDMLLDDM